jgi:hypothetical protein
MTLWPEGVIGQDTEHVIFEQNAYIKNICPVLIKCCIVLFLWRTK